MLIYITCECLYPGTGTGSRWLAFLTMCRCCLSGVHCVNITPWRGNPFGGGGGHAMVPRCGANDKQITLGQKQFIKACVAHLTIRGAGLHRDAVLRRQHNESGKMALRHLPITGGQQRGVTGGVYMAKLVNGILQHNGWSWDHVVEIRKLPNIHRQPLHHLAHNCPRQVSQIAGLQLPVLGQLWHAPLRLRGLHVKNVVESPDHFFITLLKNFFYFGPCWATIPLGHQPLHNSVP